MESVQPESKRPRLSTNWSAAGPASLPSPSPYQHQHQQQQQQHQHHQSHYSRSLDGSSGTTPGAGAGVSPPLPPHEDRRHHDQQDPYGRQPSTPTHAPSHPPPFPHVFNLRDGIKRDPGEDMGPAARRAPSAGGDGLPATPNTIPPPSPYADDPRRHMTLDTGANMSQAYRPSAFAPHGAMSHPQLYDGLPAHHSADSTIYSVFPSAMSNAKRKATRASQACDSCRQLKAKCDETKPCKGCREKGLECKYRDPIPKATDKAQADILDGINDVKQMIKAFSAEMGQVMMRMARLESALQQVNPSFDPNLVEIKTDGDHTMREASYTDSENGPMQPMPDEEEEMEENPGPPVAPGEPAIPINHTTLAGLLLGWPAIKDFVQNLLEKEKVEFVGEYPIRQEQERGLLRVYGRGEGHDSRYAKEDHGVIDIGDDVSDIASPAADWGTLGSGPLEIKTSLGFGPMDSSPDFSPDVVWSYIRSFRENILNMMPIIMPNELHAMVQAFLESLPPKSAKPVSTPTITKGFAVQSPVESVVGSKRKRSPSSDGSRSSTASPRTAKPLRTITNAVVLVALALGKICQHKEGVPDVVQTNSPSHGSPLFRNGVTASPTQPSPSLRSQSGGLPSPNQFERRRSSHGGLISRPTYSSKKNREVIPGLEYFAYATDIIGNQLGGTSMKHVWASVLAGLYHGQLGRVIESYAYISNGSKILQIIMRPSLDRLRKIRENAPNSVITRRRDNQIAFAFWTCLQLESDILAELPLPHSGILAHEDCIPYPNIVLSEDSYEPRIFESFMAQLYLRRHLNSIHKMFYHPNADIRLNPGEEDFSDMIVVQDRVRTMTWVSPSFRFNETDAPADDILAARLRAKYWGAQVITYRPFIKQILQFTHDIEDSGNEVDIRAYSQLNPRAIEYSKLGIRALIESTRAFHNLGQDRPIITNVFGTAHAQWGNMLVLGATSLDPFLGQFVDRELLELLFTKTLHFLRRSSTASCNLRRDMRILEGVENHVFRNLPPKQIYSGPSLASLPGGLSLQNYGHDQNVPAFPPPPAPSTVMG